MLLALRVPAENDRGPLYMEQALAAIHQANSSREPLALIYSVRAGQVGLYIQLPARLLPLVEGQLFAQYPELAIERLADDPPESSGEWQTISLDLWLEPYIFPIRRFPQLTDELNRVLADPVASILASLPGDSAAIHRPRIELIVRPASRRLVSRARRVLHRLSRPLFVDHQRLGRWYAANALSPGRMRRFLALLLGHLAKRGELAKSADPTNVTGSKAHDREDDRQAAADKLGRHCFACQLRLSVAVPLGQHGSATAKLAEMFGALGPFSQPRLASFRVATPRRGMAWLASAEEVASLFHFPVSTVQTPTLAATTMRRLPPPVDLPTPETHPQLTILGETIFRGYERRFGIAPDALTRHVMLTGKTGQGKTTLLEQLILSQIAAGQGLLFADPHGDAFDVLSAHVPRERTNDVVLLDPADRSHAVTINLFDCPDPAQRPLVASGVVSAFQKVFADSWGPRLHYVLTNSVLALLETPGATLVSVVRILSDGAFRRDVVRRLSDPAVRAFWLNEFEPLPPRQKMEWIASVQNKVGIIVTSPTLRNTFGSSRSTLDLRQAMDARRVVLANLSTGRLGSDVSALLGSLLITAVQLAAFSRADTPPDRRMPFTLFLDEFHLFATQSLASFFSESRKFAVNLVCATQFLEQLDPATLAAIAGNVGNWASFQCGPRDADTLASIFGQPVLPADLLRLPQYHAIVRLLVDGYPTRPFTMKTLPLVADREPAQRAATLRRTSRHRYARPMQQTDPSFAPR